MTADWVRSLNRRARSGKRKTRGQGSAFAGGELCCLAIRSVLCSWRDSLATGHKARSLGSSCTVVACGLRVASLNLPARNFFLLALLRNVSDLFGIVDLKSSWQGQFIQGNGVGEGVPFLKGRRLVAFFDRHFCKKRAFNPF
ncbi:MAG: hypothetical protein M2R46_04632 [Verrucomicrobia subdivision 3 bacterium]|nr:hypothetical protein [Limisphaerales bacterium]